MQHEPKPQTRRKFKDEIIRETHSPAEPVQIIGKNLSKTFCMKQASGKRRVRDLRLWQSLEIRSIDGSTAQLPQNVPSSFSHDDCPFHANYYRMKFPEPRETMLKKF